MKVVFITYHNWETKRHAGFHALAEHCCRRGIETVFFSFSRPYYSYFMNDERLNRDVLKKLSKGQSYTIGDNVLLNVTWPTLSVKGLLRRILPHRMNNWLDTHSLMSFKAFSERWLKGTDVFVFESNESVLLYGKIKKLYPNAKITYRPSDPIIDYNRSYQKEEIELVMAADMNFIVTEEGVNLYRSAIDDFDSRCKYTILHNGIYLKDYQVTYERPPEMVGSKIITYVGVEPIDWSVVIETAKRLEDAHIYIITPISVLDSVLHTIKQIPNIHYISGIYPNEVPAWITHSDVIITPLDRDFYKRRKSILISAKNLKPIAAGKPIVVYGNNPQLAKFGITTTFDIDSFVDAVETALYEGKREYTINLNEYNWDSIGDDFIKVIRGL